MNAAPAAVPVGTSSRLPWRRLRLGLDTVLTYLPVLLMGLLAMITYWLVRHTPEPMPVQVVRAARHVPDYFMRDFSLKVYAPDGQLEFRVQGARAEHFPDTDTLEVTQPRLTKLGQAGQITEASARMAITTPEGQQVELKGQAVVHRAAGVDAQGRRTQAFELRSDYLYIDLEHDHMRTDQAVELVRGADRFTADRLDYDHAQGLTRLTGRVRGQLQPRSTR